jgi:aryl-alcohol dehydrogenase-like predicted oxidoreductase/enamine deaminase RidA (YjgF/YER057c/UK114 family)
MIPPRITLAEGLDLPRLLTGLWQVADIERDGSPLDREAGADALVAYADAGFDGFDMADHYGTAELIAGRARQKLLARDGTTSMRCLTKWCPEPHQHNAQAIRAGVQERLDRLAVDRLDLLQLHWWHFSHPGWIDVMDELHALKAEGRIGALGVTNFDADHLHLLCAEGYEIATNQVSFSVVDRRAAGDLAAVCGEHGVRLLAYGTLCGGFLSERWHGQPEPAAVADWSKMKYRRFIEAAGGWEPFQRLLGALSSVARHHGVSVANVATRWVLDHSHVACAIIGARITEREHRAGSLDTFAFMLDEADHAALDDAFAGMTAIPGDCGDEYRRPPFLTASGDLRHHLAALPAVYQAQEWRPGRWRISSGSVWEPIAGFSRAVRIGNRVLVSGTTATHGADRAICDGDPRGQTVYALDKIAAALEAFGGSLTDVVRTRLWLADADDWEAVSRVHGRMLAEALPANTLIETGRLVGPYRVEIEAEAVLDD